MNANKNISEKKEAEADAKEAEKTHREEYKSGQTPHTTAMRCALRIRSAAQRSDVRSSGSGSSGDRDDDV